MKNILSPEAFAAKLSEWPDTFVLTSHLQPDGDGIGSMIAMHMALEAMGKKAHMILRDPVRDYYAQLPGVDKISLQAVHLDKPFVMMTFDCSSRDILSLPSDFQQDNAITVVLDHHVSNTGFGDFHLVRTDCVSSCVLAFEAVKAMNVSITPAMATHMYLGLMYDTGRFAYTRDPYAFHIAADLLGLGADHDSVFACLYRHNSIEQFKTNAELIGKLQTCNFGRIVHLTIGSEYLQRIDLEETENLINMIADIREIELVAVFRELTPDVSRIGLRSRGTHSVADLALELGGGGHRCASGATVNLPVEKTRSIVLDRLEKLLES